MARARQFDPSRWLYYIRFDGFIRHPALVLTRLAVHGQLFEQVRYQFVHDGVRAFEQRRDEALDSVLPAEVSWQQWTTRRLTLLGVQSAVPEVRV